MSWAHLLRSIQSGQRPACILDSWVQNHNLFHTSKHSFGSFFVCWVTAGSLNTSCVQIIVNLLNKSFKVYSRKFASTLLSGVLGDKKQWNRFTCIPIKIYGWQLEENDGSPCLDHIYIEMRCQYHHTGSHPLPSSKLLHKSVILHTCWWWPLFTCSRAPMLLSTSYFLLLLKWLARLDRCFAYTTLTNSWLDIKPIRIF